MMLKYSLLCMLYECNNLLKCVHLMYPFRKTKTHFMAHGFILGESLRMSTAKYDYCGLGSLRDEGELFMVR
jgi:hypothetical protein